MTTVADHDQMILVPPPPNTTGQRRSVKDVRRENLRRMLAAPSAKRQLATWLGVTRTHITHLVTTKGANARTVSDDMARRIEEVLGLLPGSLDKEDSKDRTATVDIDVMLKAMGMVTNCVSAEGVKLSQDRIARIVEIVYSRYKMHRTHDEAIMKQLIIELARD